MQPGYRRKISLPVGDLTTQTIGLFARLNSDLTNQECRTISETRLILFDVLLDLFGRHPHIAHRDLPVILFNLKIPYDLIASSGRCYGGFELRVILVALFDLGVAYAETQSRRFIQDQLSLDVFVQHLAARSV